MHMSLVTTLIREHSSLVCPQAPVIADDQQTPKKVNESNINTYPKESLVQLCD